MAETTEPRALSAALASPAFVTRGAGLAMHVANRHVERWAPEAGANRVRSLKNLGFVDRLVAPWIEAAQRSASLRMFGQHISTGVGERPSNHVSWVFPRPWYQDELDWMAAARTVGTQPQQSPSMLTTRGTYVAPQATRAAEAALPAALYEYVAPSLSLARTDAAAMGADAYSPLVPHAATQAATVMSRVMQPLAPTKALSPGLRAVLTTMLERSARGSAEVAPTRASLVAPELVTPPAPRAEDARQAVAVADQFADQSARLAELQRAARIVAEREIVARETLARPAQPTAEPARTTLTSTRSEAAASTSDAVAAERARIEERIAQRLAERTAQGEAQQRATEARRAELAQRRDEAVRLHEQARDAAARDARSAPAASPPAASRAEPPAARQVPAEIVAALSALPPELQSVVAAGIGARPERAAQAIGELSEALRTIELMARTTAAGGTFESARGPRLMMPAGLGGLVATIERTTAEPRGMSPLAVRALSASAALTGSPARSIDQARTAARVPALSFLAPRAAAATAPISALGATSAAEPAALGHVAWADRWLARFAGAKTQSLDVLSASAASPETRLAALAAAAPGVVFVAPELAEPARRDAARTFAPAAAEQGAYAARTMPAAGDPTQQTPSEQVVRYADDAETPDDVFAAISQAATRTRITPAPTARPASVAAAGDETFRTFERETLADLVAHAVPAAPGAGLAAQLASSPFASALRHVVPLAASPTFDVRALFGGGLGATYLAGLLSSATREITIGSAAPSWASWDAGAPVPSIEERVAPEFSPEYVAPAPEAPVADEAMMTVRSALLSWTLDAIDAGGGAPVETRVSAPSVSAVRETASPARAMLDAMTLPTLGESAALGELGAIDLAGAPGRASSYAAPGAIADRAHAWAVAQERSSADLSFDFVPPELVLAARVYGLGPAEAAQAARLAIAGHGQLAAMAGAVDRTFVQALAIEHERRTGQPVTAYPTATAAQPSAASPVAALPTTAFGVDRRAPRGAFLWPSASVSALGMSAASPDGETSTSVAALELLAAQAVAELGTFAALSPQRPATTTPAASAAPVEGSEQEVLAAAGAIIGSARRAKFEAMYVALGQSSAARNWSPAARAARAVALAGRGDETITARERAEIAWDVLPVLSVGELGPDGEPVAGVMSTGQAAQRAAQRREAQRGVDFSTFVDRPGLGALSARAGEALGSYVAPQGATSAPAAAPAQSASSPREHGALLRAPTAAPELVRTGRPAAKYGGGDAELPAWFAEAAKKLMVEDRSGPAENISLSELTLVTSAPSAHVAASSRSAPSALPTSVQSKAPEHKEAQLDIEKIANDVYREILMIMDATRARNGEPYL